MKAGQGVGDAGGLCAAGCPRVVNIFHGLSVSSDSGGDPQVDMIRVLPHLVRPDSRNCCDTKAGRRRLHNNEPSLVPKESESRFARISTHAKTQDMTDKGNGFGSVTLLFPIKCPINNEMRVSLKIKEIPYVGNPLAWHMAKLTNCRGAGPTVQIMKFSCMFPNCRFRNKFKSGAKIRGRTRICKFF